MRSLSPEGASPGLDNDLKQHRSDAARKAWETRRLKGG
jgi:hypothetical protein